MSEETRVIKVEVDPGLLVGTVFVPTGKTVAAPKSRADVLIRDKHATAADGSTPDFSDLHPEPTDKQAAQQQAKEQARKDAAVSDFVNWPGYFELNKGGLQTAEQLKTFIEENGTLWTKRLELSDELVEAIEAELKKLEAPKGKSKKQATEE